MPKKILIVDDSLTARQIIIDSLKDTNYEIHQAKDGNEGLRCLEEIDNIELVFSDINMPWLNGLEMIEQIKTNAKFKDIPICITTTETAPDSLEAAKNLGVNAFLIKPIAKEHLLAVIKKYVG